MNADQAFAIITARARTAAGEQPPSGSPESPSGDPLGPLARLLDAPDDTPACTTDGCTDPAYVRVLARSGTLNDAHPYCGRHARRHALATRGHVLPL